MKQLFANTIERMKGFFLIGEINSSPVADLKGIPVPRNSLRLGFGVFIFSWLF